ncbi:unnamed protein product [Toxocara canis]|uniref:RasGAP_C domain-containing protein n=1 Tax=Toxocara canis TaxID=6265 RepID=A0A183UU22_TOXCA|nr:unnamed protein product [Toxocara canis]
MSLTEKKNQILKNLYELEEDGLVQMINQYQAIVTAIAKDINHEREYRSERREQLQHLRTTITQMEEKRKEYIERLSAYQEYLDKCLDNISITSKRPSIRGDSAKAGKIIKERQSLDAIQKVKISAEKLDKQGILLSVDGYTTFKEYAKLSLEFSTTNRPGILSVTIVEPKQQPQKCEIDFQSSSLVYFIRFVFIGSAFIPLFRVRRQFFVLCGWNNHQLHWLLEHKSPKDYCYYDKQQRNEEHVEQNGNITSVYAQQARRDLHLRLRIRILSGSPDWSDVSERRFICPDRPSGGAANYKLRMESGSKRSLVERNKSPALVESKEQPSEEFVDVCKKLDPDIDPELLDKAWKQFDTVGQQYVLEQSLSGKVKNRYLMKDLIHRLHFSYWYVSLENELGTTGNFR